MLFDELLIVVVSVDNVVFVEFFLNEGVDFVGLLCVFDSWMLFEEFFYWGLNGVRDLFLD